MKTKCNEERHVNVSLTLMNDKLVYFIELNIHKSHKYMCVSWCEDVYVIFTPEAETMNRQTQ